MPARIQEYCRRTSQPVLESKAAFARSILESVALKYRFVLNRLEEMVGYRLEPLYIVGGGTQNRVLSQFAADATGRQVITGPPLSCPVEATAAGNILMQAVAVGALSSLEEARTVVRSSFEVSQFAPGSQAPWDAAYARLLSIM